MKPIDRRTLVAGVGSGVAALAGCLDGRRGSVGGLGSGGGGTDEGDTSEAAGPAPPTVDRELPTTHSVAEMLEASQSGGPEPDGIPAIDDPTFAPATDPPGILDDGDPVFGVEIDGEAKAYPQSVLVWHEIVNDVVSETPVSVTYCPLTGTAQGFYRGDTTFGVSGQLINSNLVMFDRGTESWWPQLPAIRITGNDTGTYLREFRVVWTTWDRWRSAHPETVVLTDDTGFARDYGRDPYGGYNPPDGYYTSDSLVFPALTEDDRLARKEVVIGTRSPSSHRSGTS